MPTITDLPIELIEAIADEIPSTRHQPSTEDLANLRLVSTQLGGLLAPRVLSTIRLSLGSKEEIDDLTQLLDGPNRIHSSARKLSIRCHTRREDSWRGTCGVMMQAVGDFTCHDSGQPPKNGEPLPVVISCLAKIFQHCRKLATVKWQTSCTLDSPELNKAVMDLLCSQRNLHEVSMEMWAKDLKPPLPELGRLYGLTRLSFTIYSHTPIRDSLAPIFLGLSQALQRCPHLLFLDLRIGDTTLNLDHVYSQLASLHSIQDLSLGFETVTARSLVDHSVLDNMANLTSLHLRVYGMEGAFEELWRRLKERRIHLKNISFNLLFIGPGFVNYLSSYSGVEELRLSNRMFSSSPRIGFTELATRFYDVITTKHSSTLRVLILDLRCHNEPGQVWGSAAIDRPKMLTQLPILEKLKIALHDNEVEAIISLGSGKYERLYNLLNLSRRHNWCTPENLIWEFTD